MNPQTSSSLVWFSAILILIGLVVPNPGLRFFLFVVAAICALPPLLFRDGWFRLPGLVAFAAACMLSSKALPQFRGEMRGYGRRIAKKANRGAAATQKELSKAR